MNVRRRVTGSGWTIARWRRHAACTLILGLAGPLVLAGCSSASMPATTCGPGTHDVASVCEEDEAVAIATGAGSYWSGGVALGTLYLQLASSADSATSGAGLCLFANANAVEPPNAQEPTNTCTTPMTPDALTLLTAIAPGAISSPTSFTANVTTFQGTFPVTFTLVSGDPGTTPFGVTAQSMTWSEGTTPTSIAVSGCPYFGETTCTVHTN
jgi:hypothetical protein